MNQNVFEHGSISKAYFSFSIPLVLGFIVTMLYNMADTYFIAQTQDVDLIAGVSLCAPVFTLLMAFGNIFAQGGCTLVSRLLGEQNEGEVRRVSSFCGYIALLTGVAACVVMLLFRRPLLLLLGANGSSFAHASDYYTWLALGAPLVVFNFVPANFLRSVGMSKESMFGSVIGTVVNIVLDPILISVLGWGASGAAIATVLGYVVTDVYYLFIWLGCCPMFSLRPSEVGVSGQQAGQIFGIGIPAAITNLTQSFSMVLTNQQLLPYGNDKIAAMGVVLKVMGVALLFIVGFSFGGQPIIGYLYGARKQERLSDLTRFIFRFLCALGIGLGVAVFAAAPALIRLFLKDAALVETSVLMLRVQAVSQVLVAVVMFVTILAQSTGQVFYSLVLSVSRQGVVFLAVLFIASRTAGYYGIIAAQTIADLITAFMAVVLYRTGLRRILRSLA